MRTASCFNNQTQLGLTCSSPSEKRNQGKLPQKLHAALQICTKICMQGTGTPTTFPSWQQCFSALNRFLFRRKMINKHGLSSSQSSTCYLHPFTLRSEVECSPQESFESFLAQKLCCEKERLQGGRPLSFGSSRHSRHLGFPTHSSCSQSAGT